MDPPGASPRRPTPAQPPSLPSVDLGAWNYQWLTFALTDLVIVGLNWLERDSVGGRRVFPAMLPVFVLAQLPALLGFAGTSGWQAFARWFAGLSP